ncbi:MULTISPECIES: GNAT family N-acetyltransferase [Arthrobacter]|uniref:GNAT family N-acetyltransferase n=2 Tax=Arthrobacter TaxID=1663 RepID=A0ABU9KHA3_9MICC|nr:GNAT family N-acetyltransferase [Arthrobacter sp. YJM1]MDP5226270.1 GNAT family N-acetyltransferase [Arthrobacter sp. YJM1]
MTLRLSPLSPDRFPQWFARSCSEYEADLVATGETPEDARRHAQLSLESAFPTGSQTAGNAVFDVLDGDDVAVGYVWVRSGPPEEPHEWWIYDIVVEPGHRGKGFGRATMLLAEDYARSQGATAMRLSVFGFNATARGLYESLGYETVTLKMKKSLVPDH